jgi:hypothetical protein
VPMPMTLPPGLTAPAGTVLTFMDRVHECDGQPHVLPRAYLDDAAGTDTAS